MVRAAYHAHQKGFERVEVLNLVEHFTQKHDEAAARGVVIVLQRGIPDENRVCISCHKRTILALWQGDADHCPEVQTYHSAGLGLRQIAHFLKTKK